MPSRSVVTIDGLPGTGKSLVANALRQCFNCRVVEIGPFFRLAAWHFNNERWSDERSALRFLQRDFRQSVRTTLNHSSPLSSSGFLLREGRDQSLLWCPELEPLTKAIASSPVIVEAVANLVRSLLSDSRLVIVGRETGSGLVSKADFRISLFAQPETRNARKLRQLRRAHAGLYNRFHLDSTEPLILRQSRESDLLIDTSDMHPAEVVLRVFGQLQRKLGWIRKMDSGVFSNSWAGNSWAFSNPEMQDRPSKRSVGFPIERWFEHTSGRRSHVCCAEDFPA